MLCNQKERIYYDFVRRLCETFLNSIHRENSYGEKCVGYTFKTENKITGKYTYKNETIKKRSHKK